MSALELALFTTGGTIDGADSDRGLSRPESDAARWLTSQPDLKISATAILNKDSRQITSADRTSIVEAILKSPSRAILVTHGTFTIADTARALKTAFGDTKKTVLLVGAWVPFGGENSDAPSQMEFALKTLHTGAPGVWIAMDGRLWDPDLTIKKEVAPGKFGLVEVR